MSVSLSRLLQPTVSCALVLASMFSLLSGERLVLFSVIVPAQNVSN